MSKKSKYALKVEARRRLAAKLGVSPAPYPILWATEKAQKAGNVIEGTEGQDRDNYTDDQDREFYTVSE